MGHVFFINHISLSERGCVKDVLNPPKFINPLHVVQKSSGKCWLILDLSYLNKRIWKQSVRFEDSHCAQGPEGFRVNK